MPAPDYLTTKQRLTQLEQAVNEIASLRIEDERALTKILMEFKRFTNIFALVAEAMVVEIKKDK